MLHGVKENPLRVDSSYHIRINMSVIRGFISSRIRNIYVRSSNNRVWMSSSGGWMLLVLEGGLQMVSPKCYFPKLLRRSGRDGVHLVALDPSFLNLEVN